MKLKTIIYQKLQESGHSEMLNFGSCTLHVCHNAFEKLLSKIPFDISKFLNCLFSWFKFSTARREEFAEVCNSLGDEILFPLRPVASRWVTAGSCISRILDEFAALKEYFLVTVPSNKANKQACSQDVYCTIKNAFEDECTEVRLKFCFRMAQIHERYLVKFQADKPMTCFLHEANVEFIKSLCRLVIEEEDIPISAEDLLKLGFYQFDPSGSPKFRHRGCPRGHFVKLSTKEFKIGIY